MTLIEKQQETTNVIPEGKITASNADEFRQQLLDLFKEGHHNLIINLNKVDMIDSKGLSVFIVCHKTLSEQGGALTVVTDNQDFRDLFHVMRLDEHFTVTGTQD